MPRLRFMRSRFNLHGLLEMRSLPAIRLLQLVEQLEFLFLAPLCSRLCSILRPSGEPPLRACMKAR